MIRQQAFVEKRKMLKGELHIHTTRSDGRRTPEETIQIYYDKGFDFLSLTDHRTYNFKDYRPDLPITIIPGMEHDCAYMYHCYHVVCLGKDVEENRYVQDEKLESPWIMEEEELVKWLEPIAENGNISIYCHPEWSMTPAAFFENRTEHFAMEIWNSGSAVYNGVDKNAAYWDELLGQGKVIYGVATDDAHKVREMGLGWVMVNAENDVDSILEALKNGAFYSSSGPEIYDFYVEDGIAVVKCSPAAKIRLLSDMFLPDVRRAEEEELTQATFRVAGQDYVRAEVYDAEGRCAWTNPIFLDGRI